MSGPGDITRLLADFERGDSDATEKLAMLVYGHLRAKAATLLRRERPGHSLQPTLLVNDTLLHLMAGKRPSIRNRAHFFALAARSMRQILVDHARRKKSAKRGRDAIVIRIDEKFEYSEEQSGEMLALDDALERLEALDPRQAHIVEMRFFGGMTIKEIAKVLGLGVTTLKEEWNHAKAWLQRELES